MKGRGILLFLALLALAASGVEPLEQSTESGPVRATVRLNPAEPLIGDALTLEIEVRAEPGIELLMPEFGEALDRFTIVDFVPSETVDDEGRTLARQSYTLQPSKSGPQSVPPILVEFVDRRPGQPPAPEGEDAYELLTERLEFEVESILPADAPLELRPARGELPPLETEGARIWPFVIGALLLVSGAALFLVRGWLAYRAGARRRSAYEIARAELDRLLADAERGPEEIDEFYVKLSGIIRRYLEDRFGLRSPELTTEEFFEVMTRAPDLFWDHQSLLGSFLRDADLVKFAHHIPEPETVDGSIRAAGRFLDETREEVLVRVDRAEEAAVG